MAIVGSTFKVVTEFVFNADRAISGADALQSNIQKLSDTTERAVNSVSNLGIRYVMAFSGATGGILGVLGNAIKASDKFRSTQIELANTMVSNGMKMNGSMITFNDALIQSDHIMGSIVKKARSFGISPDALTSQVKFFNNMLAPKGLAGDNLNKSIELARVSMKSAPALGVSNEQAISGIMSGISGQLSKQTQFGTRLFMEAGDVIQSTTGIKNLKEFNKAKPAKRIEALIAGLDKLAGSADAVDARADTLSARMMTLRDMFAGVGSILKPLGDVILPIIKQVLDEAIKFLKTDGKKLIEESAKFIKTFLKGPKELILQFKQLQALAGDLGSSAGIVSTLVAMAHLKELFSFFRGNKFTRPLAYGMLSISKFIAKIPILGKAINGLQTKMGKAFGLNFSGGFLRGILSIARVMLKATGAIALFTIGFQIFSRAFAQLKLENMMDLAKVIPKIPEWMTSLKLSMGRLFAPINEIIVLWSDVLVSLIRLLPFMGRGSDGLIGIIDGLVGVVDSASTALLSLWATLKGITAGVAAIIGTIAGGNILDLSPSKLGNVFMEAMNNEFAKNMDEFRKPTLGPQGEQRTVSNVINQDIKMTNNFKEVLQPDRIAFTITDQLKKEASNRKSAGPTSSTGKLAMGI